jgi:hypothetical protein
MTDKVMSRNIKNEILEVAKKLEIVVYELPTEDANKLRKELVLKYTNGRICKPWLWENFVDFIGANCPDSWRWTNEFIGNNKVIMMFNSGDERSMFEFQNGYDMVAVLEESFCFEFYLFTRELDYLLCFNHHDILLALGTAADWLEQRRNDL